MKIAVLAGGLSPERDVSLTSGSLIANALISRGHAVALADVYEGISEADPLDSLFRREGSYRYSVEENEPDLDAVRRKNGGREALIGPGILDLCAAADVVFVALHGAAGEDGHLQATLDNFNIRYTGSGYIGCLLSMDKALSKELFRQAGVLTPPGIVYDTLTDTPDTVEREIGYPCVIKPCSCGSSVGVSLVDDRASLTEALASAARYERRILAEKRIIGRELTVAVLDGRALPAVEIIPKSGFYDYKNKYQAGMTEEICPAPLDNETASRLSEAALRAHHALRLGDYARMDFILDEAGDLYCLEANALPGMTPTSLLPQEAAAVGIDYPTLCDTIVHLPFKDRA